mgnify:FL=1
MSRRVGRLTEALAMLFLSLRGLRFVGRDYLCSCGEIDLIALHRERRQPLALVFIEVRYRSFEIFGGSAESIDAHKQLRLIRGTNQFVHTHQK